MKTSQGLFYIQILPIDTLHTGPSSHETCQHRSHVINRAVTSRGEGLWTCPQVASEPELLLTVSGGVNTVFMFGKQPLKKDGSPARPRLNRLQEQPRPGSVVLTHCADTTLNLGSGYGTSLIFLSGSILFSAAALMEHCPVNAWSFKSLSDLRITPETSPARASVSHWILSSRRDNWMNKTRSSSCFGWMFS